MRGATKTESGPSKVGYEQAPTVLFRIDFHKAHFIARDRTGADFYVRNQLSLRTCQRIA